MNIKGGYLLLDLASVATAGDTGADVPGIFAALDRCKDKPVLVTYYESGEEKQQAWFTISKLSSSSINLMGVIIDPNGPTALGVLIDVTDEDHATFYVQTVE